MARAWRLMILVILGVLILGVLMAGAGLLTGASVERTWTALALDQRLNALAGSVRALLPFLPV